MLAAYQGGGDPDMNPRLRTLVLKARQVNMPAENMAKAVQKGMGELAGERVESLTYEGYGPGGIGIIAEITTDNKNRSASEVRSLFSKFGGRLTGAGTVAFNFQRKGRFLIDKTKTTEEALIEVLLETEAEGLEKKPACFEVVCPVDSFDRVAQTLEKAGAAVDVSELVYFPKARVAIDDDETSQKALRLLQVLEAHPDVRNVFTNGTLREAVATVVCNGRS